MSVLKVTVIPRVARLTDARMEFEEKAMRKKIVIAMKLAPIGYPEIPASGVEDTGRTYPGRPDPEKPDWIFMLLPLSLGK